MNPIQAYMDKHNLTEQALADKVGCDQSTINRLKRGKGKPSPETASGLMRVIGKRKIMSWLYPLMR